MGSLGVYKPLIKHNVTHPTRLTFRTDPRGEGRAVHLEILHVHVYTCFCYHSTALEILVLGYISASN